VDTEGNQSGRLEMKRAYLFVTTRPGWGVISKRSGKTWLADGSFSLGGLVLATYSEYQEASTRD